MKSKRKRQNRRAAGPEPKAIGGSPRSKRQWFPSIGLWMIVLIIVLAGGWFAVRFWRTSEASEPVPHGRLGYRSDPGLTPNGSPARSADANKQEAVVAKLNRGSELLAKGKPAEAVEVFTEAMQLNPNDEDVHYNLGLAFARLGKLDEAVQQYNEALRLFPNYVEAHNNLGNVLMRLDKTEEAIAHFELAVKVMPDYASAHNNLGTALQRMGRTNEALLHFQQAAKLTPDYWEAHFNVGASLMQAGRLDDARKEFETVLRLKPDFEPARAALAELK